MNTIDRAAARAMRAWEQHKGRSFHAWETLPTPTKDRWRAVAQAVLSAFGADDIDAFDEEDEDGELDLADVLEDEKED